MHNFFLAAEAWPGAEQQSCLLEGQEAKHLSKVLRMRAGESIRLLDGAGRTGEFVIRSVAKNSVELTAQKIHLHQPPASRCFLAAAYTKAARRSWLLEKSVELEAGGIWFWQAEFSQAKVPDLGKETWREQLIAGAKQCFNPWLPELKTFPQGAAELALEAKRPGNNFSAAYLLWEDESSDNMLGYEALCAPHTQTPVGDILFVLGPEGGLAKREVDVFKNSGFTSVSLGKRVLRWETAAMLCLGLSFWAGQTHCANQTHCDG